VLIGGTRKLSKAFFDIFLAEAQQHLKTLLDAQDLIIMDSSESYRAAHTLAATPDCRILNRWRVGARFENWAWRNNGNWTSSILNCMAT